MVLLFIGTEGVNDDTEMEGVNADTETCDGGTHTYVFDYNIPKIDIEDECSEDVEVIF